jgi:hypothetical protein
MGSIVRPPTNAFCHQSRKWHHDPILPSRAKTRAAMAPNVRPARDPCAQSTGGLGGAYEGGGWLCGCMTQCYRCCDFRLGLGVGLSADDDRQPSRRAVVPKDLAKKDRLATVSLSNPITCCNQPQLAAYGRASRTMLKGVSVARLTLENPPLWMTSLSFFSPACAPRAAPTSCDRDVGRQIMVEPA